MNINETFDLADGIAVLKRNFFLFSASILLCGTTALVFGIILPKQYKSRSVLNIQTSYFQNPMVNDLITQVNDPQELQSQRMSLLRLALDNDFLDGLANKHKIYAEGSREDPRKLTMERELFTKSIQYYSLSPTTFEITVMAKDPSVAQELTSEVLERMKTILIDERYANLAKTKNAIENHVKNLGDNIKKISTPSGAVAIQSELDKVESTLGGLLIKFTESHPEVQKLRSKQRSLSAQSPKQGQSQASSPSDEVLARGGSLAKQPSQEVYNDLLKKLSYLAIVLDMEKDRDNISYLGIIEQPTLPIQATFPNKRLLLALGLVVGIILGTFLSIIAELGRRSVLSPTQAANILDAPLLGELPILEYSPQEIVAVKALPDSTRNIRKTNLLTSSPS